MKAKMKAKTFDRKFDAGEKITDQLDLSKARSPGTEAKRVNVDFSDVDGAIHRPGGAPAGRHAPVTHQAVAGRSTGTQQLS